MVFYCHHPLPCKLPCWSSSNLYPSKSMTSHPSRSPLPVSLYIFRSYATYLSTFILSFHYPFHAFLTSASSSVDPGHLPGLVTQTLKHKWSKHLVLEFFSGQRRVDDQVYFQKPFLLGILPHITVFQGQPRVRL